MNCHYAQPSAYLCRYTLPLDRLGYFEARGSWGELVTKPISVDAGDDLRLNLATSAAGAAQVALLDDQDRIIPGFSWEACGELIGNELEKSVFWSDEDGHRRIGDAGQRKVRLYIRLYDSRLYAFVIDRISE